METSLIKLIGKYKLKGLINDLKKYAINMFKFYGISFIIFLGIIAVLIFFSQKAINSQNISLYFNYLLPLGIIAIMVFYMFSNYTLVIFSKPDIFYLLKNKKLFKKIAWCKLIKQNLMLFSGILGISYAISYNLKLTNFFNILASFLLIVCALNLKYYIFNNDDSKKKKAIVLIFLSLQLIYPNIYFIALEYIFVIRKTGSVFDNLNIEKLVPICNYVYEFDRIIKTNSITKIDTSEIIKNKEDKFVLNNFNIFFKLKKELAFCIKDYKTIKNRAKIINIILIILTISFTIFSNLFDEYKILLYVVLYLIFNAQLKNIFSNNYFILLRRGPLFNSIKNFIKETSYFSLIMYLIINTLFLVSLKNLLLNIVFLILLSICEVLTSNYNGLKNFKISIFNLFNIILVIFYITNGNHIMNIFIILVYGLFLYKILHKSISIKINFNNLIN